MTFDMRLDPSRTRGNRSRRWIRLASGPAIVACLAGLKLAIHLSTSSNYGIFIDELYFLACGEHLDWGYVDMPPLTGVQTFLARFLFGDSMLAIRLFPSLAGAGIVLMAGAVARELGGGRYAQALAALAALVAPVYLATCSYISMNSIEPLLWMGCIGVLLRMVKSGNTRLWILFGVLGGLGLQNKHTMAIFGCAVVVALLLVSERRLMANRWFLLGGAAAFLIFLPNLIWMVNHGFPHLEQLANIRRNQRNVALSPLEFLGQEIVLLHPLAAPIWIAGLGWLFAGRKARPFRSLGWAYLAALALLLVLKGRVYYLAPAYPMLLAAGAAALEAWFCRPGWSYLRPAYLILLALGGAVTAPMALPILPPETYIAYSRALGLAPPRIENRETSDLPQLFADRFGWPEMVAAAARIYRSLPAADQAKTAFFCQDYGSAGAIDFYGPRLGLPKAVSGHLTYWYWGPREHTGEIVIVLGSHKRADLENRYASVVDAAVVSHPYSMRSQNFTIYLCREPRGWTLREVWPKLKNWN
ncbi:MAG: glycosyltransferase family 39 protein [Planctomycetes bacterium]|nr:glycosyltransferase family 39 protein [Planctomycetota bacterium]